MTNSHRCLIGLGSNLAGDWGNSRAILRQAVRHLAELGTVRVSKLYRSPPHGPQDQPDYLNAVVALETTLPPLALLDELQRIEHQAGRQRLRHWGERTLDLDLLFYADWMIDEPRLTVPHPQILKRDFVVLPVLDVARQQTLYNKPLSAADCLQSASATVVADQDWINMPD